MGKYWNAQGRIVSEIIGIVETPFGASSGMASGTDEDSQMEGMDRIGTVRRRGERIGVDWVFF